MALANYSMLLYVYSYVRFAYTDRVRPTKAYDRRSLVEANNRSIERRTRISKSIARVRLLVCLSIIVRTPLDRIKGDAIVSSNSPRYTVKTAVFGICRLTKAFNTKHW